MREPVAVTPHTRHKNRLYAIILALYFDKFNSVCCFFNDKNRRANVSSCPYIQRVAINVSRIAGVTREAVTCRVRRNGKMVKSKNVAGEAIAGNFLPHEIQTSCMKIRDERSNRKRKRLNRRIQVKSDRYWLSALFRSAWKTKLATPCIRNT
ncbi:transposase [Rhodopirellula bahusiensis]|uniref:Transposase IS801/IS1294 domain-containing protein n=1 Tax=Rhodopirellula bahusiensis TaxID=2014065 RepID=A0A2G1W2H2_9BACT|nr:hypothetical protein CEE69_21005 [Rhodopirellula bahusiensis]